MFATQFLCIKHVGILIIEHIKILHLHFHLEIKLPKMIL